jgi:gamma-glutamyl:cysteine ligase YbdK (ATP-grasp superfamily)
MDEVGVFPIEAVLQQAIDALTAGDCRALDDLLGTASETKLVMRDAVEAIRLHRGLAMLLKETARNLRLMRIASGAHPGNAYGRQSRTWVR